MDVFVDVFSDEIVDSDSHVDLTDADSYIEPGDADLLPDPVDVDALMGTDAGPDNIDSWTVDSYEVADPDVTPCSPAGPTQRMLTVSSPSLYPIDGYILKFRAHYGSSIGSVEPNEVFFDQACDTEFDTLRMRTEEGDEIPLYRANYGNYELVRDEDRFGSGCSSVIPGREGEIYLSGLIDGVSGTWRSDDNGVTWQLVIAEPSGTLFVDSRNYVYAKSSGEWVKRSVDGGQTWETVLDLTEPVGTTVLKIAATEDAEGNVYIGRYQSLWDTVIWKSEDEGAPGSFNVVYADEGMTQHVHGLAYDPFSDYVYAALDASGSDKQLMRIEGGDGDEWEVIWKDVVADVGHMFFRDDMRVFGTRAGGGSIGVSVVATLDDETFFPVLRNGQTVKSFADFGDAVYGTGVSYRHNYYPQIYMSKDDGLTWETVWIGPFESDVGFSGYEWASAPAVPNSANGEPQAYVSGNCGVLNYPVMRLFSGIPGHHEATFYARLPDMAPGATTYELYCDPACGDSSFPLDEVLSKEFADSQEPGEFRWSLDECYGVQADSAGPNPLGGTVTSPSIWSDGDGRTFGYRYPRLSLPGCHLALDGEEYFKTANLPATPGATGFAMVAWFEIGQESGASMPYLASGGNVDAGWELRLAAGGYETLYVWNGEETCFIDSTSPDKRLNAWIQDGFFLTWDDESPTITYVSNGMIGKTKPYPVECGLEPFLGGGPVSLGGSMFHDGGLVGAADDLFVAQRPITALELRSTFEMRPLTETEPTLIFWEP